MTIRCPHGCRTLDVPGNAELNMESYHKSVTTVTNCCGKMVTLHPIFTYSAIKYEGPRTEDDWGQKPFTIRKKK